MSNAFDWKWIASIFSSGRTSQFAGEFAKANKTIDDALAALRALRTRRQGTDRSHFFRDVANHLTDIAERDLPRLSLLAGTRVRIYTDRSIAELKAATSSLRGLTEADSTEAQLDSIERNVVSGRAALSEAEARFILAARRRRMLTRVAFGIPTIVALVAAGILLLRDSRMTMTTVEAVVPVDTSANLSSKRPYLDLTPTNLDSFLDEFALAYFGHPNSFAPMFIEAAPPTELFRSHNERPFEHARHRWKMTLQNVSTRNSTFVSSAEFRMRLMKDQPFPWHRLNVTPHLDVTLSMVPMYRPLASMGGPIVCEVAEAPRLALLRIPMITLRSDGVAPAFEVRVRGRTDSGLEYRSDVATAIPVFERAESSDMLVYRDAAAPGKGLLRRGVRTQGILGLQAVVAAWSTMPQADPFDDPGKKSGVPDKRVRAATNATLVSPFFLRLSGPPDVNDFSRFQHSGFWYEIIRTTDRLSQVTQFARDEQLHVDVEYASVDGGRFTTHLSIPIPEGVILYERKDDLVEFDPRRPRTCASPAPGGAQVMEAILAALAEPYLGAPKPDPKGVDLLSIDNGLDLHFVNEGETAAAVVPVERFFNPHGVLFLNTTIRGAHNGVYECEILIGGTRVGLFYSNFVVPETLTFADWDGSHSEMTDLIRLRRALGDSRPAINDSKE